MGRFISNHAPAGSREIYFSLECEFIGYEKIQSEPSLISFALL